MLTTAPSGTNVGTTPEEHPAAAMKSGAIPSLFRKFTPAPAVANAFTIST
jgi:hypothetical protein